MSLPLNGSSQWGEISYTASMGQALTLFAYFKMPNPLASSHETIISLNDDAGVGAYNFKLKVNGSNKAVVQVNTPAGQISKSHTLALVADTWYKALVTHDGVGNVALYIDDESPVTDLGAVNTDGDWDTIHVGTNLNSSAVETDQWSGKVAYAGVWDAVLGTTDRDSLLGGAKPNTITTNLVDCWDLIADADTDKSGGTNLTLSGSPTFDADDPLATGPTLTSAVPDQETRSDVSFSLDFSTYFSTVDHYAVSGLPAGTALTLSAGVLSGTPNEADIVALNDTGITVTGWDATESASASDTFNLTVLLPYDALPATAGGFLENDIDVAANSTFEITTGPTNGTYTPVNGGGVFTTQYVPNPSYAGADSLVYRVKNRSTGELLSGTVSVWMGVPLKTGSISDQTYVEDVQITPLDVAAEFDGEETLSAAGIPAGSGLIFQTDTGILSGTPNDVDVTASPYTITFSATNSQGTAVADVLVSFIIAHGAFASLDAVLQLSTNTVFDVDPDKLEVISSTPIHKVH